MHLHTLQLAVGAPASAAAGGIGAVAAAAVAVNEGSREGWVVAMRLRANREVEVNLKTAFVSVGAVGGNGEVEENPVGCEKTGK